jgi:hypothetical protein
MGPVAENSCVVKRDRATMGGNKKEQDAMSESAVTSLDVVRVRVLPDGRMDRRNAARYLGHAEKTLAQWAITGKGPRSVKVSGRVFYFQHDLDEFVRQHRPTTR